MSLSSARVREGITLIEVLVAIFIMGVGLLALLVLFPLGALSMARAVRDDRAAAAGANASSLAIALDFRNDPTVLAALSTVPAGTVPGGGAPAAAEPGGPGYAVYIDPFYAELGQTTLGSVANTTPGLTRCNLQKITTNPANGMANSQVAINQLTASMFSFLDEITFDNNGQATGAPAGVRRPQTYTWAYLLRRPQSGTSILPQLSVVVYGGRSLDVAQGENSFTAAGGANSNGLTLTYAGTKPNVRKGVWLLDTTYSPYTVTVGGVTTTYGSVNGQCYQIASAVDSAANQITIELESNLKANVSNVVVMDNVIAVLERGSTWKP